MNYLSQFREGEFLFYLDLNNLQDGINQIKIKSTAYEHTNGEPIGCGFNEPEDTWEIVLETKYGPKSLTFNKPYFTYYYFNFKGGENINGKVKLTQCNYIVGVSKEVLISTIKTNNGSALESLEIRKRALENELSSLNKQYEKL